MKKRNYILLSELELALFKEEAAAPKSSGPDLDPVTGAGDAPAAGDFLMISGSDKCPGCQVGYNERVAGGSGSSTSRPIHHEDEPERAILLMDLPKPSADWTMKVTVDNEEMKDTVDLRTETGNYKELYSTLTSKYDLVHQESDFFTVLVPESESPYWTYMHMNQKKEVIRLTHQKKNTFDVFRVSFLVRAK
ncbi:MAG: hypothetical protein AAGN35_09265 [Bacteroidota bacterium]